MPRELVHWHVLERAVERLSAKSVRLQAICRRSPSVARLGAITHDAPYYLRLGKSNFQHVAERLHGANGTDSFQPLREFACAIPRSLQNDSPLWAFCAGLISHAVVDAIFHPMIFYFTGNYHALDPKERSEARARHRLFEVHLDSWIAREQSLARSVSISHLFSECRTDLPEIIHALASVPSLRNAWDESNAEHLWMRSFHSISRLQLLFLSPICGAFAHALNSIIPIRELESLFSFGRIEPDEFFSQRARFKNPATGDFMEAHCSGLLERSIEECVRLFVDLDRCMTFEEDRFASNEVGPSLDSGIVGARAEDLRFFADTFPEFR